MSRELGTENSELCPGLRWTETCLEASGPSRLHLQAVAIQTLEHEAFIHLKAVCPSARRAAPATGAARLQIQYFLTQFNHMSCVEAEEK